MFNFLFFYFSFIDFALIILDIFRQEGIYEEKEADLATDDGLLEDYWSILSVDIVRKHVNALGEKRSFNGCRLGASEKATTNLV